jgi:muconolactone D-isomerase
MHFLVQIDTSLPPEMPLDIRDALLQTEFERGTTLRADGVIQAIWRVPGRLANVGIWNAPDADSLHTAITSLPAWPWMSVTVTPLAVHPLSSIPMR